MLFVRCAVLLWMLIETNTQTKNSRFVYCLSILKYLIVVAACNGCEQLLFACNRIRFDLYMFNFRLNSTRYIIINLFELYTGEQERDIESGKIFSKSRFYHYFFSSFRAFPPLSVCVGVYFFFLSVHRSAIL